MNTLEQCRGEIDTIDRQMAALFERRMAVVEHIVAYKKENSLPVLDSSREEQVIAKNSAYITDSRYLESYKAFMQSTMDISKAFQQKQL